MGAMDWELLKITGADLTEMVSAEEVSPATVVVSRLLPADPATVFAAWTDAASLSQWFCPGDVTVTVAEIDARVGGRLVISMRGNESDPPRRLVFSWRTPEEPDSRVTIELRPRDGGTELTLVHERISDAQMRENYRRGWGRILKALDGHLARAAA